MRWRALALVLFATLLGCEQREPAPPLTTQPEAVARAMSILHEIVDAENYQDLGFDSIDAGKRSVAEPPLAVFNIGLNRLKSYQPGGDLSALLVRSPESVYPVSVDGQVRSSVTLVEVGGRYRPSRFGNAPIIANLAKYRHGASPAAAAAAGLPVSSDEFVVRVPALDLYFLGQTVAGQLMLTPVVADPRLHLQAGVSVPASTVILQLVPIAIAIAANDLPT